MKNYRPLLDLICVLSQFVSAQRGVRLAYIDMDEILENVDEYATASQLLEQNVEEWKKEIEVKKMELKGREEQLQAEKVLLTLNLLKTDKQNLTFSERKLWIYNVNFLAQMVNTSTKKQIIEAHPRSSPLYSASNCARTQI